MRAPNHGKIPCYFNKMQYRMPPRRACAKFSIIRLWFIQSRVHTKSNFGDSNFFRPITALYLTLSSSKKKWRTYWREEKKTDNKHSCRSFESTHQPIDCGFLVSKFMRFFVSASGHDDFLNKILFQISSSLLIPNIQST